MPKVNPDQLIMRVMKKEDIGAIVEIDAKVLGEERHSYYDRKCATALDDSMQMVTSLVAVYEDNIIGFIMGNVFLGEFGIPESVATFDTIGVHPDYQGQGVAVELIRQFVSNLKKAQVEHIYTFVNWNDWKMLRFLEKSGFGPSKTLALEMKLP
jgi:predicted N-acetyltransferase YhbS